MSLSRAVAPTFALLVVLSVPSTSHAEEEKRFAELKLSTGKVLTAVRVTAVEPDGLRLQHTAGVSKVRFADLPEHVRREYPHDSDRAAAFAAQAEAAHLQAIQLGEQERSRAEYDERCRLAGLPAGFHIPAEGPLTIAHVKGQWLLENIGHMPTFGEPDRALRESLIAERKALILSGALDREAEEISLRHNLDWYLHHGKTAEAEIARQRLADMQMQVAQQAQAAALEKIAESLSRLSTQYSYRTDIITELSCIRGELDRVHGFHRH
jgi:hypothetical protein